MFSIEQYELVDFGAGEKLERFSGTLVRRPCPAAHLPKKHPKLWKEKTLRYQLDDKTLSKGRWSGDFPKSWQLQCGPISFGLTPTPFGHLGVFPEQSANWDWIANSQRDLSGLKALNLFAYTGGTSLALAARGAHVVHIDSSKSIVKWARQNAELSGLGEMPIRWIVEDAITFVARELKRGNRYDIIVADPPSFGHGLKRQSWKYERDIESLIAQLAELTKSHLKMLLITGHTIGFGEKHLSRVIREKFGEDLASPLIGDSMTLLTQDGRNLGSGYSVRYVARD